jgi:hypothetical protein
LEKKVERVFESYKAQVDFFRFLLYSIYSILLYGFTTLYHYLPLFPFF